MPSVSFAPSNLPYTTVKPPAEPTPNRQKRETTVEPAGLPSREHGDRELAVLYGQALARSTGDVNHDITLMIENIPSNSTFGQWWSQLGQAFESPQVAEWMRHLGINRQTLEINPASGQVTFEFQRHIGKPGVHTRGLDDPMWSTVSGPVIAAANVIGGHTFRRYKPALTERSTTAPLWLVQQFYRDNVGLSPSHTQQRATQLQQGGTFPALDPAHFSALIESRSEDRLEEQKALIAHLRIRQEVVLSLRYFIDFLKEGTRTVEQIPHYLNNNKVNFPPGSTYSQLHLDKWNNTSLTQFLQGNGLDVPTNQAQMENLATALSRPEAVSPIHGNYSGALDWLPPLDPASQRQLRTDMRHGKFGDIDLSPFKNVLEYLLQHSPIDAAQVNNPRLLIDALIQSPKGQVLGEAIQAKFDQRHVKGSATDWLLAALSADQNDVVSGTPAFLKLKSRQWVAGYPLSASANYGKSAPTIVNDLADHLLKAGSASCVEKAAIQAYVLLSRRAPEFLVKDIPVSITFGSHSWVSFVTAVERIEAQASGATAMMSYGQVMLAADVAPLSAHERQVEYAAQTHALRDWGAAHGFGYALNDSMMSAVREAYNEQIQALQTASDAQKTPVPEAREMAIDQLKKALPEMNPALFDKKCIHVKPSHQDFPGPYSVLDLYMDGRSQFGSAPAVQEQIVGVRGRLKPRPETSQWVSSSTDINIGKVLAKLKDLPRLSQLFDNAFTDFCAQAEKASATQVKYLISKLPLEDREHLEFGKITILTEWNNRYEAFSRSRTSTPASEGSNLLVKTEVDGTLHTYEIDLKNDKIIKRTDLGDFKPGDHPAGVREPGKRFQAVVPSGIYAEGLAEEQRWGRAPPKSFGSAKTAYIADAMVKEINIRSSRALPEGSTTFDTEVPFYKKAHTFMLNLIPLRSAINNFANGSLGEGILDLTLDAFGFAVGLGAAAKGAKALQTGVSAFGKLAHSAKIVGRAAIGSLNPLSGIDDLARGLVGAGRKAVTLAHNGLTTLRNVLSKVDPAALAKTPGIAEGVIKPANALEDVAVIARLDEGTGKWHAINPATRQPYGPALRDFKPKVLSRNELCDNLNTLHQKLGKDEQFSICYATALRSAQADKKITQTAYDRLLPEFKGGGTQHYKHVLKIEPQALKSTFNAADITESGVVTFI
ncbi:MAG: hypothetical protein WBB95_05065, partial [Pseudomonas sp.]|uniref:hypothetical protein n=1 Tax=Pseudomonas sp. TaxID=306 RepID=UPI003C72F485